MSGLLLSLLLAVAPAHAGKKSTPPAAEPVAAAAPAAPALDPAFEADIRKLLELTGAAAMGQQMMDQMMASMKPMMGGAGDAFWEDFRKEVDANELVNRIVPVYAAHLTHDEVKQLIVFFESPVGRKLVAEQPAMMQESMLIGQQWGAEVAERVITRMGSK